MPFNKGKALRTFANVKEVSPLSWEYKSSKWSGTGRGLVLAGTCTRPSGTWIILLQKEVRPVRAYASHTSRAGTTAQSPLQEHHTVLKLSVEIWQMSHSWCRLYLGPPPPIEGGTSVQPQEFASPLYSSHLAQGASGRMKALPSSNF